MIPKVKGNVQNSASVQYRKPSTHYFAINDDNHIMENNLAYYVTSQNIYKLLNIYIYICIEQHVILTYFVCRVLWCRVKILRRAISGKESEHICVTHTPEIKISNKTFSDVSAAIIKNYYTFLVVVILYIYIILKCERV